MQQSNAIVGALVIAYIVFITQRGELPVYLTLLRGGGKQPSATGGAADKKSGNPILEGASALISNNPFTASSTSGGFIPPSDDFHSALAGVLPPPLR